jgi:hypothetical protein
MAFLFPHLAANAMPVGSSSVRRSPAATHDVDTTRGHGGSTRVGHGGAAIGSARRLGVVNAA